MRADDVGVPRYQAKAEFFKTLGHPARIRILELLSERDHAVHELLERSRSSRATSPSSSRCCAVPPWWSRTGQGGEVIYSSAHRGAGPAAGRPPDPVRDPRVAGRARGRADAPRRARWREASARWSRPAALLPLTLRTGLDARPGRDLTAGVMVGLVALPLALGFGVSSGIGAGAGLVTAVVAGALAAVFGGSRVQVSGPTGAMTVVLVPIVATYGADGVLVVGLLAGLILIGLGVRRSRALHPLRPGSGRRGLHPRHRRDHRPAADPAALGVEVHAEKVLVLHATAVEAGSPTPLGRPRHGACGRRPASWSWRGCDPVSPSRSSRWSRRPSANAGPRPGGRDDRPRSPPGCPRPRCPPRPRRTSTPCCCRRSRSPPWPRWRACCRRRWPTR